MLHWLMSKRTDSSKKCMTKSKRKIRRKTQLKAFNAITFCLISLQSVMVRKREQPSSQSYNRKFYSLRTVQAMYLEYCFIYELRTMIVPMYPSKQASIWCRLESSQQASDYTQHWNWIKTKSDQNTFRQYVFHWARAFCAKKQHNHT